MPSTISVSEILTDTLEAFKVSFPMLKLIATDFSADTLKLNQTAIARISKLPTVRDYDGTTGYKANAASATALFEDVPVTINRHKHVPVKIAHLDQIASQVDLYKIAIANLAYSLGKEAFDYVLSLSVAANITGSATYSTANSDKDALDDIRGKLNLNGASLQGRFGIVSTAVMNTLQADIRVINNQYKDGGQGYGANPIGWLKNISGFENIIEYPGMPDNGENQTGLFAARDAIVMASRLPDSTFDLASQLGIPSIAKVETVTDPDTGLSLLGIVWQEPGTFDLILTVAWMYGAAVGAQGGATGTKTDKAGIRLVTA